MNNIDLVAVLAPSRETVPAAGVDKNKAGSDFESFFKSFKSALDKQSGKVTPVKEETSGVHTDVELAEGGDEPSDPASSIAQLILQMTQNVLNSDVPKEMESIDPSLLEKLQDIIENGVELSPEQEEMLSGIMKGEVTQLDEKAATFLKEFFAKFISSDKPQDEPVKTEPAIKLEPAVTTEVPVVMEDVPVVMEDAPVVMEDVPVVMEEVPAQDNVAVAPREVPVENAPKTPTEIPVGNKVEVKNIPVPDTTAKVADKAVQPEVPVVAKQASPVEVNVEAEAEPVEPKQEKLLEKPIEVPKEKVAVKEGDKTLEAVQVSQVKKPEVKFEGLKVEETLRGEGAEKISAREVKFAANKETGGENLFGTDKNTGNNNQSGTTFGKNTENQFNILMSEASESGKGEIKNQPTLARPYDMTEAKDVSRLMKTMESVVNKGESKLTVTLTPENLGRLEIRLVESGGKITAKFFTDNETSHKMMLSQGDAIRAQLSDKGIVIDNMEFAFTDTTSKEGTEDGRRAGKNNGGKKTFKNTGDDLEVGNDIATNKKTGIYA